MVMLIDVICSSIIPEQLLNPLISDRSIYRYLSKIVKPFPSLLFHQSSRKLSRILLLTILPVFVIPYLHLWISWKVLCESGWVGQEIMNVALLALPPSLWQEERRERKATLYSSICEFSITQLKAQLGIITSAQELQLFVIGM